ncbi:MAG: peptidoglycan-binding protein [Acidobacteria bacterium]|nr:peptidoglycan-binding protein [Acidobacteriota bacterium]
MLPFLLLIFAAAMLISPQRAHAQSAAAKKKARSAANAQKSAAHKSTGKSSSKSSSKKGKRTRRQPGQKAPTADRINEIQTALAKDGSFSGTPNGKWDDSTVSAMKKYQSGHGLNPTGRLDAPTLQKLGLGSTTAGVAAPQAPPGSVSRLTSSKFNSAEPSSEDQR